MSQRNQQRNASGNSGQSQSARRTANRQARMMAGQSSAQRRAVPPAPSVSQGKRKCVQLSKQCSDYCRVVCNPFEAAPVGMPTLPALPTLKQKAFARGTATTGTAGIGFIAACPDRASYNDVNHIRYSTAAFAGTTMDTLGAGTAGETSNSSWASADLGVGASGVASRVVGYGLRARYAGTELNRGGRKVALVEPTHATVNGRSENGMNLEKQSRRLPVNREWTTLIYRPVKTSETEFTTSVPDETYYMGVMIIAADAATQVVYEWESFVVSEFQGRPVRGQTHTQADPVGYAATSNVLNQMNGIYTKGHHQAAEAMVKATHHTVGSMSGVVDMAKTVAPHVPSVVSGIGAILEDVLEIGAPLLALL